MITRACLLSLSSVLVMGAAIGQTPSWPIVNGRQLQPTQQQIDGKEDERTRQRNRDGQSDIDRLYEEITRAAAPPGLSPSSKQLEAGENR